MVFDDTGALHVYAYNISDEKNMDHIVSRDCGKTWEEAGVCFLDEGIRNPQVAQIDGVFVAHGRNTVLSGFVFYTSEDGYNWDGATYLARATGPCYYSNNIVLKDKNGKSRMLIQYSECFGKRSCVNVKHVWLTVEK
jgi:hypothetical protein